MKKLISDNINNKVGMNWLAYYTRILFHNFGDSQRERVLNYLTTGKTLTPRQAQNRFNIWRLAAITEKLKNNEGFPIGTVYHKTASGRGVYAEYFLMK